METAHRLGADLQRDGINAIEERAAVELPPALHGAGVYLSYAPLALAPRYAQPIGAVDVPRAAEPRLGVDAKLDGDGQVDSVIQGACGARQLVLRAPRFPSAGGGQDQLRPRERGLAGDLRELRSQQMTNAVLTPPASTTGSSVPGTKIRCSPFVRTRCRKVR